MKKTFKFFALAAAMASIIACGEKEPDNYGFASMGAPEVVVDENCGTVEVEVLLVSTAPTPTTVTFSITNGAAVEGENFSYDGEKSIVFNAGETSKKIAFNVVDKPGEYAGALDFTVTLTGADNKTTLGTLASTTVTINDLDHPLVSLITTFDMTSLLHYNGKLRYITWPVVFSAIEGKDDELWASNLNYALYHWPSRNDVNTADVGVGLYVKVSEDHKTITVPLPQYTESTTSWWDWLDPGVSSEHYMYALFDESTSLFTTDESEVHFILQEDGETYKLDKTFGVTRQTAINEGQGELYFYYTCFANEDPNQPTLLKKHVEAAAE